jgi:hypothetical protein
MLSFGSLQAGPQATQWVPWQVVVHFSLHQWVEGVHLRQDGAVGMWV